jgi:hypothetical protein
MRLSALLVGLLATASVASAASADRNVTSPGTVQALARSGYSVAFLSGPTKGHCGPQVRLWNLVNGGVYPLGRHTDAVCNEGPSGGSGVSDIAVAGNRALWLAYAGGNLTDWTLYTATTTRPTERMLEFKEVDAGAPSPIVLGTASEQVLPYSLGATVKVLKANGAKAYTWQAPGPVTNSTAHEREVAAFVKGGKCYVLSPGGTVTATYTFPAGAVQEFALSGVGLVVQLPHGKVEIHKGASVKTVQLPAAARMLDYDGGIILYKLGKQIRGRRVFNGKDTFLRYGRFGVLEHNGLSYAAGKRVSSIAWVNVTAAINNS